MAAPEEKDDSKFRLKVPEEIHALAAELISGMEHFTDPLTGMTWWQPAGPANETMKDTWRGMFSLLETECDAFVGNMICQHLKGIADSPPSPDGGPREYDLNPVLDNVLAQDSIFPCPIASNVIQLNHNWLTDHIEKLIEMRISPPNLTKFHEIVLARAWAGLADSLIKVVLPAILDIRSRGIPVAFLGNARAVSAEEMESLKKALTKDGSPVKFAALKPNHPQYENN